MKRINGSTLIALLGIGGLAFVLGQSKSKKPVLAVQPGQPQPVGKLDPIGMAPTEEPAPARLIPIKAAPSKVNGAGN